MWVYIAKLLPYLGISGKKKTIVLASGAVDRSKKLIDSPLELFEFFNENKKESKQSFPTKQKLGRFVQAVKVTCVFSLMLCFRVKLCPW